MHRTEKDTMGTVRVAAERLWGAQTQRSLDNFKIGHERMPMELVVALAMVKKAAALENAETGELEEKKAQAIALAADEVIAGKHALEFPLAVWQTGSGTQTNMNVNEVIANRASELLGGERGEARLVHPNDDVNRGQSSNDAFPTAMHVCSVLIVTQRVLPAVAALRDETWRKARAFTHVVKIGRTHLMDATPLTLGQEMSGWVSQLTHGMDHVVAALSHLHELALGGTAVGTGLNAPRGFADAVIARLAQLTKQPFSPASSRFEALACHDALVHAHGALKTLAVSLHKIANDVRWLASGPRCGIGEIVIPDNEPGSSIMPGKVNPTQCEAMTMACAQVLGNDTTIGFSGASGNFELNVYKPVIINAFLQSARLLADACDSLRVHCIAGLAPNEPRIAAHLSASLMLVTALNGIVGYDRAAEIAKNAHANGLTLRESAVQLGVMTAEEFDAHVDPSAMVGDPVRDIERAGPR